MNDLFDLYYSFIEHISMLKIKKTNSILIDNISNSMNILSELKNVKNNDTQEYQNIFITKMNNIFRSIKEKKNKDITDISSFQYFLKCIKSKPEDKFLNIYNLDIFELNIYEIGNYLQNNDLENYNVFYNHFLLLYIEICNNLYEEKDMKGDVDINYNMIMNKFTEDSFNSENISENIIELVILIINNVFKNNITDEKYNLILQLLNDENLPSIIEKIIKINMSEEELQDSNNEIKKLSKSEITEKINFYMNKFNNINIQQFLQNIDLKNILNGDISSIMTLLQSDLLSNIPDLMENFSPDLLSNLPIDPTLLQSFKK